ncbi:hypothetical protein NYE69_26255 [Paenibacillus sp. FSL R5-0527]|uniref:hypothetical protein n=1 Tax=Paenibacillus sp. FSL R5-0527 TaxID=2975321 RepID=UPI00097A31E7|nr:hypothetical protein BK140_10375 [Paenibacillus macerans]
MSTRAVVIDSRVDGKGFWVYEDGYPADLGVTLRNLFSKDKSIEQIFNELVQMRTERTRQIMARAGYPMPNMNNKFRILTPEQVDVAKKSGIEALWDRFRIGAQYIYRIRQDGVFVSGVEIPKLRRVQARETIRG